MKCINFTTSVLLLFSSVYAMEIVPLLKQENKIPLVHYVVKLLPDKAQKTTIKYIKKLSGYDKKNRGDIFLDFDKKQEINVLQQKIHMLSESMYKYSDTISEHWNIARGAAAGSWCGCMSGTTIISGYGIIDGCAWCWCNAAIPKITCNMMMCGLSSCGCAGCLVGTCCVITGYAKKKQDV